MVYRVSVVRMFLMNIFLKKIDILVTWSKASGNCVSTRVMLIRNMTSDGLTNGAMGTVTSVNYEGKYIINICVFYDETIGRLTNVNGHQLISIERIDHEYIYHDRTAIRRQFPLMQSWACTIHKVKGMVFDEIVVDVGSSVLEPGMAYVALSCNAGKWWTEKNFFRGLSCSIVLTYWYKYHCHV